MYKDLLLSCMNASEKAGDYAHAIELYQCNLQEHPSEVLYYRICFCAFELHRKDEYNKYYYQFLQRFPESSLISRYLAIFYHFFSGNIIEIREILDDIGNKEIRLPEIYCLEMGILLYDGKYRECLFLGEKSKDIYPDNWAISYYYASVLLVLGRYYLALDIIKNIDVREFPYILDLKLKIVTRLGKGYTSILDELKTSLYSLNAQKIDYNAIGNCYCTIHKYTHAIAFYTYTMRVTPHDNYAYNGIGNCYLALGKYQMARAIYAQGLKNMHGIYVNYSLVGIAKSYMLEGNHQAADSLFQDILEKHRRNPYILFEAAKNMYLGNLVTQETLMYLDEALALNPHYGAAKRLKKKILQETGNNFS